MCPGLSSLPMPLNPDLQLFCSASAAHAPAGGRVQLSMTARELGGGAVGAGEGLPADPPTCPQYAPGVDALRRDKGSSRLSIPLPGHTWPAASLVYNGAAQSKDTMGPSRSCPARAWHAGTRWPGHSHRGATERVPGPGLVSPCPKSVQPGHISVRARRKYMENPARALHPPVQPPSAEPPPQPGESEPGHLWRRAQQAGLGCRGRPAWVCCVQGGTLGPTSHVRLRGAIKAKECAGFPARPLAALPQMVSI